MRGVRLMRLGVEHGLGIAVIRRNQHLAADRLHRLHCTADALIEGFDGGPVGIESLAAAIGEERGTLEDVVEPFLIQRGLLMRTARGRVATRNAWLHLGLTPPKRGALPLFEESR